MVETPFGSDKERKAAFARKQPPRQAPRRKPLSRTDAFRANYADLGSAEHVQMRVAEALEHLDSWLQLEVGARPRSALAGELRQTRRCFAEAERRLAALIRRIEPAARKASREPVQSVDEALRLGRLLDAKKRNPVGSVKED